MQQETLKLNKVQFIRLKKIEKTLREEFKQKDSIQIDIPPLNQARLSFKFSPALSNSRQEELVLLIESKYFEIPLTERGNYIGHQARIRDSGPVFIPLNRSFKNQKISIRGINKACNGGLSWNDSDMVILQDHPLEKIIGFNSAAQPNNYEAMICIVTFH